MTITGRSSRFALLVASVLAAAGVMAFLPLASASSPAGPRDIVVVARDMAFHLDGQTSGNPTIRVRPGERVRIVLVNDDAGFDHDFAVSAWSTATSVIHGKGQTSVVLQAPLSEGQTTYVCSMHASMMTGTIEVTSAH